jgi:hypothetical protein
MRICGLTLASSLLATLGSLADSYTIPFPPGYSAIANQLDNGGNTLDEVLTNVPDQTRIFFWDCTTGSFSAASTNVGGHWVPGATLSPGGGALIFNPLTTASTLTFAGSPHVAVLPLPLPCGCDRHYYLVSSQTATSATFTDIMGFPPAGGTMFYHWTGSTWGSVITFSSRTCTWMPSAPLAGIGEAVLIYVPACSNSCPVPCLTLTCAPNKTVECGSGWSFDDPRVQETCCGTNFTLTILSTVTNSSGPCSQVITRTWQATDCSNNTATCSQTVTVTDTTPPVLTCAGNKSVECGSPWAFDPPTAVDACCGTNVTITVLSTVTNTGFCAQLITRTWQASDCCANVTSCSQTVSIVDTTPPVLTCAGAKTVECGTPWTFDIPSAVDACCGTNVTITVLSTVTNAVSACSQTITRTWQANDCCTNLTTCSQTVTVVDSTPPVLTCAGAKTVECGSPWNFDAPTAVDACCGTNVTITVLSTVTNAAGPCSQVITRTWQAKDCCTNLTTCSQTVTVVDTTPPVLTCVGPKTVECGNPWNFDVPTASDACCGTNVTITVLSTVTNAAGPCSQVITRTWQAGDCCTNLTTCSQTVTILDTTPPVLTCAGAKTVECGSAWAFDVPSAVDACCGTNVTITVLSTVTNTTGPCSQVITRTWQAGDCCTNLTTCSQTVTIVDTTPPVVTCAGAKTVECGSPWNFDVPTASDACCGTNVTITVLSTVTNAAGPCSQVITRTWQAGDCCANLATCSQTVTIVDTIPPVITCAGGKTVQCGSPWSFDPPAATDACSGTNVSVIVLNTVTNGAGPCSQIITRTWQAADCCGNTATCSQTVTIAGVAPPPNDDCAQAVPVGVGSPAACGSTAQATPSPFGAIPPPCGTSSNSPDVWYTFTPVCAGTVTIDTCGLCSGVAAGFDTVLSVYTGACGALTPVACNDDAGGSCGSQSRVTFGAARGVTYHIRVAGNGSAAGDFRLNITATATPPLNDSCADAIPLGAGSPAACGSTACATPSPPGSIPTPCGASTNSPDVWYTFTPTCDGPVTVDTCGLCPGQPSPFDTVLSAYTGACGALIPVICNDDAGGACGVQSQVTFFGTAGVLYYIRVAGANGASGDFRLNLTASSTVPINDDCANAIPVTIGSPAACGSTVCATPSAPGIPIPRAGSLHSRDVWYSFTPPCHGLVTVDTCGLCPGQVARFDTVLSIYSGTCDALHPVSGDDDDERGNCGLQSRATFVAIGGATYLIRVAGSDTKPAGPFRLNISQTPAVPPNDLCANARPIGTGTYSFNTCGADTDGPVGDPNCLPAHDVWFRYTCPCSGQVFIDTCNSSFDTVLAVYTGTCPNLALVVCNDNATAGPCSGSLNSFVSFSAVAGVTYYIRIGGAGGAQGSGLLTLSGPYPAAITCPPANGPCLSRLFRVVGTANNTPWSWSIEAPCCAIMSNTNVPGVPVGADADTLAIAFAQNINAACAGGGIFAQHQPDPNIHGLFMVCVRSCSTVPAPFVFRVGPAGKLPTEQCAVADFAGQVWPPEPLCAHDACEFNPGMVELPLANQDLNHNGVDDAIDIMNGTSADLNLNGIPDEVEACLGPEFLAKSDAVVASLGTNVTLSVTAAGTPPLSYQWSQNGLVLDGATNSSLSLTSLSTSQLGDYTISVSNGCGTNTSGPITVSTDTPQVPVAPAITAVEWLKDSFLLTFATKAGWTYVVEYKNGLSDPAWTQVTTVAGDGYEQQFADFPPLPGTRFYRVRLLVP